MKNVEDSAAPTESIALRGRIVTDYEVWPEGTVLFAGGAIREISPDESLLAGADTVIDHADSLIIPGLVDLQVNGGFGVDVVTAPDRLPELSKALLATGVTAYLPTVISSPKSLYHDALPDIATAAKSSPGGAWILGVHLEGPFLAPEKCGAHDTAHILPPDPALLIELLDLAPVRMLTLAPEIEGADELIHLARDRGVVVSAGHSGASFETAYPVLDSGVASVTHLFNAMSPLDHREPGLPGAAFAHPNVVCGLISDGLHVHPETVNLAFRMLGPDRIYLVTDATAGSGMHHGQFSLATRTIFVEAGVTRLDTGQIAGSILTMAEAFRNILAFTGCTIPEAVRMASTTPARLVGEGRRKGRLVPGFDADITVLAPDFSVGAVYRGGTRVYNAKTGE